jgi:hypothetical protein
MERLFSPCTRHRDALLREGVPSRPLLQELNLDVSLEEFLSAERAFTYADLYAMFENEKTVAWLTPNGSVVCESERTQLAFYYLQSYHAFAFVVDGKAIHAAASSPNDLLEICDVVLRLATSAVHSVVLHHCNRPENSMINARTLACLMEQSQSLKMVSLEDMEMDENHCRVLGTYSRPDLKIELHSCKFTSAGIIALAEVVGRNQGPTKLNRCDIHYSVLANWLRGNSRLKHFKHLFDSSSVSNREVVATAGALRENKGLVELELRFYHSSMNDETWGAVCASLKTHPKLEVLGFTHEEQTMAPEVITSRTQVVMDMIKINTSMHTLRVNACYSEHEMYPESVIPYLETNRLRPRLLAIQKARPILYRTKVLGRALLSARTDANSFWMLLSGNMEVAFPPTTATTTLAANLPTHANADASAAVAATAAVTAATTRAASSSGAAAAAANDAATPTASQKRKVRP